jgi:hypothetical protein
MRTSKNFRAIRHASEKGCHVLADGRVLGVRGEELTLRKNPNGYLAFGVYFEGKTFPVAVHQLAAYQYFGEAWCNNPHLYVRHLDGDKTNNSRDNLALGTASDNNMDKPLEVRRNASKHNKKITDEQALAIKRKLSKFVGRLPRGTMQSLATEFGCPWTTINGVRSGRSYSHLQLDGRFTDEMRRRSLARPRGCSGVKHLTDEQVAEIKNRLGRYVGRLPRGTMPALAAEFACPRKTIDNIRRGKNYKKEAFTTDTIDGV